MNTVLIFAGGSGNRMRTTAKPKQFLEVNGKPIIIHTLEHFENHKEIDSICIVCISEWIDYCKDLLKKFNINKVINVVEGGKTGQESIFKGLVVLNEKFNDFEDTIVLVHDGVRPLINEQIITDNIDSVKKYGTGITVVSATETIVTIDDESNILGSVNRHACRIARAPQSFFLREIYENHLNAIKEGNHDFVDSATLMQYYGSKLHAVLGPVENIKITTPSDYYIFRAILEAKENMQIIGL